MDRLWVSFIEGKFQNDDQLYHLLSDILVRLQTVKTLHPEASCKLLNVLDERHIPVVHVVTCTLLSCICNLSGSVKGDLASRGAVSSLVSLLKITVEEFSCEPASSQICRLHLQLIEQITSMLQYFSVGKSSAVKKLLHSEIFSTLVSIIDVNSCLLSVNGKEAVDTLKSLIAVDRKLVGQRQVIVSGAAEYVCSGYFGSENVSKVFTSESFVVDVYDTSTNEDIHIADRLSELCGSDKVWLYAGSDDPEIDDPENAEDIWVDVHVTHIINGAYFWAVLGHSDKESVDIMPRELEAAVATKRQILLHGNTVSNSQSTVSNNLTTGQLVYVLHKTIGWYRAQVILLVSKNSVRVFAVDYGFINTVPVADVFIPDDLDLLKSVPALSHLCKLKGVRPVPASRNIFFNVLGTLCNLTASEEFWSKLETDGKNFSENGLPAKLFHFVNCPDVEIQMMALQIYANLARIDALRPLVMESGVCKIALDIISTNKSCSQTPQWAQLLETCLQMIANLVYNCNVNRDRFVKLQGLHILGQLCVTHFPEGIKRSVAKAVKSFIGDVISGVDSNSSQVSPCAAPVKKPTVVSAKKLLLDIVGDDVGGGGDGAGVTSNDVIRVIQKSERQFDLNERLTLLSDQCNELRLEPVEQIDRDTVIRIICSFLNGTSGGSIYFGIQQVSDRSGSIVRGVRLSHSVRDRLRVSIDKLAIQYISPAVAPGIITTKLHTVVEPKTGEVIADLRVVEITVKRPPFQYMMPTLYTCKCGIDRHGFIRINCLTKQLTPKDIYTWTVENIEQAEIESILEIQKDLRILRSVLK